MSRYLFTSESVSEGHPDKMCDYISDSIVDAFLEADENSRVAAEAMATTNRVILAGEVRGPEHLNAEYISDIARKAVREIGYEQEGFHWKNLAIDCYLHQQSEDIAIGVDEAADKSLGAGDQGIMFGYSCNETETLMPAPIYYSHLLLRELSQTRRDNPSCGLGPDAKSQISMLYENEKPVGIPSIVVSIQHREEITLGQVEDIVKAHIHEHLPKNWLSKNTEFFINPTGRFVIGGPDGDTGLTGRKIIVDTYGGAAPHGGGAFSGKDPTKVDRSAAYAARYLAKNVVAAGLANKCLIQLSYAIGISKPLSLYVTTYGTGKQDDRTLEVVLAKVMDLSPYGIRQHLQLNRPIYKPTASYGHFGRKPRDNGAFSWEKTDLIDAIKAELS